MNNRNRISAALYYLTAALTAVLTGYFVANDRIWQAWVAGFITVLLIVLIVLTTSRRRQL